MNAGCFAKESHLSLNSRYREVAPTFLGHLLYNYNRSLSPVKQIKMDSQFPTTGTLLEDHDDDNAPPTGCGRARLSWANGALAFVNGPHAWMLKELVKHYPDPEGVLKPWITAVDIDGKVEELELMSKYVLCSPENEKALILALSDNPKGKGKGREAYLMSRAGTIVERRRIMLHGVGITEKGRTTPLTVEGTHHQLVLITVDGRDDIVKWKLGLFSAFDNMSEEQQTLHAHIEHDNDEKPPAALPEWAKGAIVLMEKGATSVAEHIIKSNDIVPQKGDIIISPAFTDIVWNLLRTELAEFVFLYTIKGNLRYRIEKLGIEDGYDTNETQKELCKAADKQRDDIERMERITKPAVATSGAGLDLDAFATGDDAGVAADDPPIRSWTHPYACPTCGLAYMKWGLCYAHMGDSEECSGLLRLHSFEELQQICRAAAPKAEGSPSDLFLGGSEAARAKGAKPDATEVVWQ